MLQTNLSRIALAFVLLLAFIPFSSAFSQVSVSPSGLSACACDPIYFDVNLYSDRDDVFQMEFDSGYPFSSFIQSQVPVPEESTIKTTLVLNTACNAQPGNYSFSVTARGRYGASTTQGFAIIRSCRNLELSMPAQQSVCSGGSQSVLISLRNNGLEHEEGRLVFTNLPQAFYYVGADVFDLNPGETRNFLLSLQPPLGTPPSTFSYTVRANNAVAMAGVEISSCNFQERDKIIMTPSTNRVEMCAGTRKSVSISLKNDGQTASFDLTSSGVPGVFSANKLTIGSGSTRTVDFSINAENLQPGNKTLTLNAFGPASSDSDSVNVVIKDCLDAVFGDLELCLGDSGSIPFSFKNNNPTEKQYNFSTRSDIPSKVEPSMVLLSANEAVSASIFVTGSALGSYNVFVFANSTILRTPRIIVKACLDEPLSLTTKTFEGETGVEQNFVLRFNSPVKNVSINLPPDSFFVSGVRAEGNSVVITAVPLFQGQRSVPARISANSQVLTETLAFTVNAPSIEIREKGQNTISSTDTTVKNELFLSVFNKGSSRVTLTPSMPGASFEPTTLVVNSGEERELKVVYESPANSSIAVRLMSDEGKTYTLQTTAVQKLPSGTTGFFTATRAVGLFAVVVVIAIIVLALVLKRDFEKED